MTTLAQRVKATRDAGFITKSPGGVTVNRTEALASIGGSALNNEECYLIAKLSRALGIVYLETRPGSDTPPRWPRWGPPSDGAP